MTAIPGVSGRVVVITGGNQGVGREIALAFAEAEATVVITARTVTTLETTAEDIRRLGGTCHPIPCDVTDEASLEALAGRVLSELGGADTVIANAGIAGPTRPLAEISLAEWRECLAVDLDGVFLTFRAFIPQLAARSRGSLVAVSSMTGKRPLENRTPYAAAKLGVIGLVRTLAVEVGHHGIRANCVVPGAVSGPRIERVIEGQVASRGVSAETVRAELTRGAALGRMVSPEEVARACLFLASDASSGISGEDLNVSAGMVMY